MGHAAGGYCTALLAAGKPVNTGLGGTIKEITVHTFDEKDRPLRTVTDTYEPFFVYAGRMSLEWVFEESFVSLGNELVLTERSVEEYEYAGDNIPKGSPAKTPEPVVYQRPLLHLSGGARLRAVPRAPPNPQRLSLFTLPRGLNYVGSLGLF